MKTHTLLFLFILISSVGFAQSGTKLYYSVDAKGWTTKNERDAHEDDLQVQMKNNIANILKKGKATATQCESVENSQTNALNSIKSLRGNNADMLSLLLDSDFRMLKSKGIIVESKNAIDNEPFFLSEMADVVNFYIEQYQFSDQWVQATLKGENRPLPWEPDSEIYFREQNAKVVALYDIYTGKINLVLDAVAQAQKEWDEMDAIIRPTEEREQNRVSKLEQKGYLFYSLDGREYKTRRERIDRNNSLGERLKETLAQNKVNSDLSKKMEVAMSKVFHEAQTLQRVTDLFEEFGDFEEAQKMLSIVLPNANFGIYQSKSGETFYTQSMADSYDCLCSIYSIVNQSIDKVNKIAKQQKAKNADDNTEIFFEFDELTDANGKNCLVLFKQYQALQKEMKDTVNSDAIQY